MRGGTMFWGVVYCLLVMMYALVVPLYESPDEFYHYALVDAIANTRALPVQSPDVYHHFRQEGSQPPLYYLLGAALIAPIPDRDNFPQFVPQNPHMNMGIPGAIGNKNRFFHPPPYTLNLSGAELATRLLRLWSSVLGLVTVWAVFRAAQVIAPHSPRVAHLAAGLTVFNAQFLFISGSVNNDNLVTALNSLTLWGVLVLLRDGFRPRLMFILAVLAALASLGKLSGLVMYPVIGVAMLIVTRRTGQWRTMLIIAAGMVTVWVVLAGWWYARNLTLYGELFGTNTMLAIFGRRDTPPLPELLHELTSLTISYWGVFGWFNVLTFDAYYTLTQALMLVGTVGGLIWLWRTPDLLASVQMSVLLLAFGVGFVALVVWTMQTTGTQGRLLFPYLVPVSLLLAVGLNNALSRIHPGMWLVPLGVCAVLIPPLTLAPEYRAPAPLTELPTEAVVLGEDKGIIWRDEFALVAYQPENRRYARGDIVTLMLYWQPLKFSPRDFSLYVHLINPLTGAVLAKVDTYPALGRLRTSTWQVDMIYPDEVRVRLPQDIDGAFPLEAYIGWRNHGNDRYLTTQDGVNGVSVPIGGFYDGQLANVEGFTRLDTPVSFGGLIRLDGYTLNPSTVTLHLLWRSETDTIPEDLRVSVFALQDAYQVNGANIIIAQADGAPTLPTIYWQRGDSFITEHLLAVQDSVLTGIYPLYVGWYSTERAYRVPALNDLAIDGVYPLLHLRLDH